MLRNLFFVCLAAFALSCNNDKNGSTKHHNAICTDQSGCNVEVVDSAWYHSGKKAPLFSGLSGLHYPITTKNAEAQKYFDQGLLLAFGFNHAEAARSFYEGTKLDSTCAMCWWGYAYVLGPNYNAGMEKDNFIRAFNAVEEAVRLSGDCTRKEQQLIKALWHRHSADTSAERAKLDASYADAMREVYKMFPDDATIASIFAESIMDMHPWQLWNKDGTPQSFTPEIITVLEKALKQEPKHIGANHFY